MTKPASRRPNAVRGWRLIVVRERIGDPPRLLPRLAVLLDPRSVAQGQTIAMSCQGSLIGAPSGR
jgi:hypothetical protein